MSATIDLARGLLQVAVPLRIMELRALPPDKRLEMRLRWIAQADDMGVFTEAILVSVPREGATAQAFNALGRVLAALAYVPGGITFAGEHWEVPG